MSSIDDRPPQAADDPAERDAAGGMCLGIEEHLHVADVLVVCPPEVRPGQIVEVVCCDEHLHSLVVADQEGGQVIEAVRRAQLGDIGVGELGSVALSEREPQLGFEGPFDVQVQLDLGQATYEGSYIAHGLTVIARGISTSDCTCRT